MGDYKKAIGVGVAATGLVVCGGACIYSHYANQNIDVTQYRLRSGRVPEAFKGFRIAHVSDLQSQYFGKDQKNLLGAVRSTRPDIIVITGDLVDRNHTDYMASIKALSGLRKIAPVYYVNGNHEVLLPEAEIRPFFEEMKHLGIRVLLDEIAVIERGDSHINIVGVSEYSLFAAKEIGWELGKKFESAVLAEKLQHLNHQKDDAFSIMLVHEPQYLEEYAKAKPDVIFSGHAHGGQFRLPNGQGLYSPGQGVLPKLTQGIHLKGKTAMVVSRGLGNSRFPVRLNNHPEVVLTILE